MSKAEFTQLYYAVGRELAASYESPPRLYEFAEALHMDKKTFSKYLKVYNLPFPPDKKIPQGN
jgi:hypothetical protein